MKKPKNLKSRNSSDTMKPLEGARLDPFGVVEERGWGTARDLTGRNHMTFDWRLQWGDTDRNKQNRKQQLVEITIGKERAIFSRQEIERYLRHV